MTTHQHSVHESLSPEDLNARLIQVLEEVKVTQVAEDKTHDRYRSISSAGIDDDMEVEEPTTAVGPMSPVRNQKQRYASPNDAFKDVFSEYGAKLSPALMRLQLEGGGMTFDEPIGDDDDDNIFGSPAKSNSLIDIKSSAIIQSGNQSDSSECEEEAFLAIQRKV